MFGRRLIFGFALTALGCTPKIGDECRRSDDCSLQGERSCDLSYTVNAQGVPTPAGQGRCNSDLCGQGECTIEACGRGSCPDEAVCVKVYGSDFLSVACDPAREDLATVGPDGQSLPPLDECMPNEVCLAEGLCADEITARTSCRLECDNSDDCRAGYTCVATGSRGIYVAPNLENPADKRQTKICAPTRQR